MHCQSQISIIRNNGVERAHKSKNADKTHLDKLYEQGGHKGKKKEKSGHWSKCVSPGHLALVLQVLNQALGVEYRPAATALPALAGSALQSACSCPSAHFPVQSVAPKSRSSTYQAPCAHQTTHTWGFMPPFCRWYHCLPLILGILNFKVHEWDDNYIFTRAARVQRRAGPGAVQHRCHQPAPGPIPEYSNTCQPTLQPVQTYPKDSWMKIWCRSLLAQVALGFLQQALFPKSILGTCPSSCLLPQISHYSTHRCHQAGMGMWNQDLCGVKPAGEDFSPQKFPESWFWLSVLKIFHRHEE